MQKLLDYMFPRRVKRRKLVSNWRARADFYSRRAQIACGEPTVSLRRCWLLMETITRIRADELEEVE